MFRYSESVRGGCGRSDGGVMEDVSSQDIVLFLFVYGALLWREQAGTRDWRRAGGID